MSSSANAASLEAKHCRVDISDKMASYYTRLRKTLKWYRKLIIEIVYGTIFIQKFAAGKKVGKLEFRDQLIKEMISNPAPGTNNQLDDAAEEGRTKKAKTQVRENEKKARRYPKEMQTLLRPIYNNRICKYG
ncbi:uncharacterized protein LOC111351101 [Spodoptera litura]|uniref:Uncharacterized protein LOC111351101 n=1 Tax=Spodoptera litura TaxID=69820 RepID=A0A9J7IKZ7_SPOLT|nr:uncharacterized protein LOC111351101 [Spodoptera litura]